MRISHLTSYVLLVPNYTPKPKGGFLIFIEGSICAKNFRFVKIVLFSRSKPCIQINSHNKRQIAKLLKFALL